MTPWRKNIGCAAIAAGLLFGAAATALAHTMPLSEATMILPKPPYGQMEIVPHETPMENLDAFGVQFMEKSSINNGQFRFVRYSVYSGAGLTLPKSKTLVSTLILTVEIASSLFSLKLKQVYFE